MDRLERVARAISCAENNGDDAFWPGFVTLAQAAIDAMEQWQQIETAPHDTELLLYCPFRHESNPERIETGKATRGDRGTVKSTYSMHAWATHWMPLPEPPK